MAVAAKIQMLRATVEELGRLSNLTEQQRVKDILFIESRKVETQISSLREAHIAEIAAAANPGRVRTGPRRTYNVRLPSYAWDQSDKFVKLYIKIRGLEKLNVTCVECGFTERAFSLRVNDVDGKNYILKLFDLLEKVHVGKSYWKKRADSLFIYLGKKEQGIHWSHLTALDKKASEDQQFAENAPQLMNMVRRLYVEGDDEMRRTITKACEDTEAQLAA